MKTRNKKTFTNPIKRLKRFFRRRREEAAYRKWSEQNKTVTLNGILLIRKYEVPKCYR